MAEYQLTATDSVIRTADSTCIPMRRYGMTGKQLLEGRP
jgi:hypothetical protein